MTGKQETIARLVVGLQGLRYLPELGALARRLQEAERERADAQARATIAEHNLERAREQVKYLSTRPDPGALEAQRKVKQTLNLTISFVVGWYLLAVGVGFSILVPSMIETGTLEAREAVGAIVALAGITLVGLASGVGFGYPAMRRIVRRYEQDRRDRGLRLDF